MLNYVWIALLFLGILSALIIDISDISQDRYRNGEKLNSSLQLNSENNEIQKGSDVNLIITTTAFNNFYDDEIDSDISLSGKVISITESKAELQLNISENSPMILKELASGSGDENDLTGTFYLSNDFGQIIEGKIIFEEVSFSMMKNVTNRTIEIAGVAVEIALGLIGIMALWLGIMKVAEDAGLIAKIARALRPITKKLFPDVPSDHPAIGAMVMNISANMLGLGNAATPFGLKAMEELDKLNPEKGTATNAMVTFLAINTAGLTLIPATAIAVRAASGSSDPTIIIGTSIFGAFCATVTGITAAKVLEKFYSKTVTFSNWIKQNLKTLLTLLVITLLVVILSVTGVAQSFFSSFTKLDLSFFKDFIQVFSTLAIPLIIIIFVGYAALKKVKVYEQFVEGAKEGFNIAIRIIPYLVAMLVAIAIFRAGGAMDNWLIPALKFVTDPIGMPAEALPMALMRPLSGSGSLGIMTEIISVHGADSFIGILVSTFFGSTETTFYVLAVYFGAVNIRRTRHAVPVGLLADIAGILGALFIVNLLFG